MQDVNLKAIQFAVFFATLNLNDRINFVSEINKVTSNTFDGEPLLIPLPSDAPPEFPRIILKSKDEKLNLNISLGRIDLIFENKTAENLEVNEMFKSLSKLNKYIYDLVIKNFSGTINRLGLIITFNSNKLNLTTVKNFINNDSVDSKNNEEVNINLFARNKIKEFDTNNWTRITGQSHDQNRPGFVIMDDINIRQDKLANLNSEVTEKFFSEVFKANIENIKKYVTDNYNSSKRSPTK